MANAFLLPMTAAFPKTRVSQHLFAQYPLHNPLSSDVSSQKTVRSESGINKTTRSEVGSHKTVRSEFGTHDTSGAGFIFARFPFEEAKGR